MKKETMKQIAIVALYVLKMAAFGFGIYIGIMMLNDASYEIKEVVEAIGELAEEAWGYCAVIGIVAMLIRDFRRLIKKLQTKE